MPFLGEIAALSTAACWALTSIFFGEAGRRIGAIRVNAIRLVVAAALYALLLVVTTGSPLPRVVDGASFGWLALSAIIGLVIGDSLLFHAFVVLGPRLATLIFASSPIMVTALAWVFLGESLSLVKLLGIAVTIAGITWVVSERAPRQPGRGGGDGSTSLRRGILFALGGAFGQAAGLVTSKQGMLGGETVVPAADASFIRILVALVITWLIAAGRGRLGETARAMSHRSAMGYAAAGAFVGPFLGVWMSLVAVGLIAAGVAATLNAMVPVMVIPLVIAIYREPVSLRAAVGACVAVGGVAVIFLT
jgi:drug/metabolite transporter (DMT)-like permease